MVLPLHGIPMMYAWWQTMIPYLNTKLLHPKIQVIQDKSTLPSEQHVNIDYSPPADIYPPSFLYFI